MKHEGHHKNGKTRPSHGDTARKANSWERAETLRSDYERQREERDRRDARKAKAARYW